MAITTPIYGRLADLYGRRRVTYLGSTALFLAGLACSAAFAWSMPSLILFRAIQGLGGGRPDAVGHHHHRRRLRRPRTGPACSATVSGMWGIAAIAGPLIGSVCVGTIGWPWVFWLNLPVGVLTMALGRPHTSPSHCASQSSTGIDLNLVTTALLTGGHRLLRDGGIWSSGDARSGPATLATLWVRCPPPACSPSCSCGSARRPYPMLAPCTCCAAR